MFQPGGTVRCGKTPGSGDFMKPRFTRAEF
jgi:hypothetical protein